MSDGFLGCMISGWKLQLLLHSVFQFTLLILLISDLLASGKGDAAPLCAKFFRSLSAIENWGPYGLVMGNTRPKPMCPS